MNLQQLNNEIHASDKSEFLSKRASWVSQISTILGTATESQIEYFRNHTGRELFRKAHYFQDSSFIQDDFDSGFRPNRIDPETGLNGGIISWYDAADHNSYELDSNNRISKVSDKSGSFDLSNNKDVNLSPTIDSVYFDDNKSRNIFYYGDVDLTSHNKCTMRSYDFSHDFSSDGELNILLVVHHLKSDLGATDSQDFIFEAAQNGLHNSGTGRFFLRKTNDTTASPNFNNSGLGTAIGFDETESGMDLENPVNLLLNIHLKNGEQVLRLNGSELKTSAKNPVQNITNEAVTTKGDGGGGFYWGANIYGQQSLEGGFGEILLYNNFAEDGEFLESYLAKKWGFTVPNTNKHFRTFS